MIKSRRFYINIWDGCNLKCRHCFNYGGKTEGELLSASETTRVVEEAHRFLDMEEVQLTGGEPLQRPDIFVIIESLIRIGVKVLIQTNGVFDLGIREQILKLPEDRISLIISLDGIHTNDYFRGQGVAAKAIDNLNALSQRFQIRINTLLSSKIEWDEVEDLARIARNPRISLAFNPICPAGRADCNFLMPPNKYFEWMRRLEDVRTQGVKVRKCFDFINGRMIETEECPVRTGSAIHTSADGSACPCGFLANNPLCSLGSVRDFSMVELLKRVPSHCRGVPSECFGCEFHMRGYCHAGCPARIYALNGTFDKVDVYCIARYLHGKGKR